MSERPVTKGQRILRLAGMTASVAGNYARARLKSAFQSREAAEQSLHDSHQRSGELIAKTLGELKGAVMKIGQMASIASDLLPTEVATALSALQREAPPMPYDVIAEQVEREFGTAPELLFQRFERTPFASASIGQVHRAITDDGREVVVKVQYPGVDGAVNSDLSQLKFALRASGLVNINKRALDAVFAEIRLRLEEELDYCNEADNVRLFAEHYRDRPDIVVPQVIGERSSQRVLTLAYEPGDHLDEARNYPQAVRDQLGQTLFDLVADQIFNLQTLHADPNPGNFAFRPDGTIVLYDFGCVKRLHSDIVDAYRRALRAGFEGDYAGLDQGLIDLGARNSDGPAVPDSFYAKWRDLIIQPFASDEPYDFGSSSLQRDAMLLVPEVVTRYMRSFQPPAELVFVDRVVMGHYGTLQRLGAKCAFRAGLLTYLNDSPS